MLALTRFRRVDDDRFWKVGFHGLDVSLHFSHLLCKLLDVRVLEPEDLRIWPDDACTVTDVLGRFELISGDHPHLDVCLVESLDAFWYLFLQVVFNGRAPKQYELLV